MQLAKIPSPNHIYNSCILLLGSVYIASGSEKSQHIKCHTQDEVCMYKRVRSGLKLDLGQFYKTLKSILSAKTTLTQYKYIEVKVL